MFRKIAGRLTGTAASTVRIATAIPVGVARSVLEHVTHRGSEDDARPDASESPQRQQPPQREPQEQAAETARPASKKSTTPAAGKKTTPAKTRAKASTPKAGAPQAGATEADDKPDVVLAVDAPPAEIEPPVDVVGEALAAEKAEEAQQPRKPQPVHVNDDNPVVYSTTSDD